MKTLESILEVLALSHATVLRLCLSLVVLSGAMGCRTTTAQRPATAPNTPPARAAWLEGFARGYFPGRSGQIFLVAREGDFIVDRNPLYAFMHGSPWSYDTHIPLLLYGPPYVTAGASDAAVSQQQVVPTLAALLGTAPPATATRPILPHALADVRERPRVVVLFVLDGTRADYFDTYAAAMPTLSRLRHEGAWRD